MDGAEEGDVALPQLEDGAGPDGPGEHRVADQGPGLAPGELSLILKEKIFYEKIMEMISYLLAPLEGC